MKKLPLLTSLLLLSACATTVRIPSNRLDSPEASGRFGAVSLAAGDVGTSDFLLTPNYSTTAPSTSNPQTGRSDRVFGELGLGLLEHLDISYRLSGRLEAKYQFVGAPRTQSKAGNFSAAVTGGVGYRSETDNGVAYLSVPASSIDIHETILDGALIAGYRVLDWLLVYGGAFYTHDGFHGGYSTNNVIGAYSGSASLLGENLGLDIGNEHVSFKIEGAATNAKLGQAKSNRGFLGGSFGVSF